MILVARDLGWIELRWIYDHILQLITVMIGLTTLLSAYYMWYGRQYGQMGKVTGALIHDFMMGTAPHPRFPANAARGFDFKFFAEGRFTFLWFLFTVSFASAQYNIHGFVSTAMWLVVCFQSVMTLGYFWGEQWIVHTIDIKEEQFGFGLVFGIQAWTLPCLFGHIIPWFYFLSLAGLLVQRERRDNDWCKKKYGEDWDRYCEAVPWRIVPRVY